MENSEKIVEQPNSCEISINQKGIYSGKVKVYGNTIDEAFTKGVEYSDKLNNLIKEKNKE